MRDFLIGTGLWFLILGGVALAVGLMGHTSVGWALVLGVGLFWVLLRERRS